MTTDATARALVQASGKGEQHCRWCGRMSYIGDAESAQHHDDCPSYSLSAALDRVRELEAALQAYVADYQAWYADSELGYDALLDLADAFRRRAAALTPRQEPTS